MTIFGYVRVSTVEQSTNGSSLAAQQSQIAGYMQMRGWPDAPVFMVESGVSGSVPLDQRPEGTRLLSHLKPGDSVVVTKLDRMFRSAVDALGILEQLKAFGVSLHMLDLGGDVTGNGISKLVFSILAAVAEAERDRIRERIRDVKQHMKAAGMHHGGRRPFGWRVEDKRYVPVENEQAVIGRIRELAAAGAGARRISTALRRDGLADFAQIQVQRILDRPGALA